MLINSSYYESGQKIRDIEPDAIQIRKAVPGFYWLAYEHPDDETINQLANQFELPKLAAEDVQHSSQYPKLEEYDDTLFTVLDLLEYRDGDIRIGELAIFVRSDLVLSFRKDSDRSFKSVRQRCEREPENLRHGAGFVFYALMDAVVDHYFPVIEALEVELEAIEQTLANPQSHLNTINRLYALKRKVTRVRHAILPLREVCGKLYGGRVPAQVNGLGDYFRDISDHLGRLTQILESLRDTITLAVQVAMANTTVEQTITTRRLAAWAAIFAVPTIFTGIWGMNFHHMPELQWELGYPLAMGSMAGITVWLYKRLRKRGWL